jgi:hypothetical protein
VAAFYHRSETTSVRCDMFRRSFAGESYSDPHWPSATFVDDYRKANTRADRVINGPATAPAVRAPVPARIRLAARSTVERSVRRIGRQSDPGKFE